MKGFVFTFDALFATIIVVTFLLLISSIKYPEHAASEHSRLFIAQDMLTIYEKKPASLQDLRAIFLSSSSCGTLTLRDSAGNNIQMTSVCGCNTNVEVSKRSILQVVNGSIHEYLAEVKICQN